MAAVLFTKSPRLLPLLRPQDLTTALYPGLATAEHATVSEGDNEIGADMKRVFAFCWGRLLFTMDLHFVRRSRLRRSVRHQLTTTQQSPSE